MFSVKQKNFEFYTKNALFWVLLGQTLKKLLSYCQNVKFYVKLKK